MRRDLRWPFWCMRARTAALRNPASPASGRATAPRRPGGGDGRHLRAALLRGAGALEQRRLPRLRPAGRRPGRPRPRRGGRHRRRHGRPGGRRGRQPAGRRGRPGEVPRRQARRLAQPAPRPDVRRRQPGGLRRGQQGRPAAAHGHHPDRGPVPQQRGDDRPRRRLPDVSDPEWADSPADHRPLLRRRAGQAGADLGAGGAAQPDAVDADAQHRQGPGRAGRLRQRRGRPRRLARAVLRRHVRPRHRGGDPGDRHPRPAGRGLQAADRPGDQARHGRQRVGPDRPGRARGAVELLPGAPVYQEGPGPDHEPRSPDRRRSRRPVPHRGRHRPQRHGLDLQGQRPADRQARGRQGAVDAVRERPRLLLALPARGGDRPPPRPPLHPAHRPGARARRAGRTWRWSCWRGRRCGS